MSRRIPLLLTLSVCVCTGLLVAGCPNQGGAGATSGTGTGTATATGTSGTKTATGATGTVLTKNTTATFTMVTAIAQAATTAAAGASGASAAQASDPAPNFTLVFNATNTQNSLSDVCQASGASGSNSSVDPTKTCLCSYTWPLTNVSDSSTITRVVTTAPTQVTSFEVQCPGPDVFNDPSELPDHTIIKIQLIPDSTQGNNTGFKSNVVDFTKQPITATGDFRDAEGHSFRNIFHYSCFDIKSKNLTIAHDNKVFATDPISNTPINAFVTNGFKSGGGSAPIAFSAQSYYFDFYIRSNEKGSINGGNAGFVCPQVNVNGNPSFFPLDSSFALALQKDAVNFPVTISGRTVISVDSSVAGPVIGFAAKPNADGSCPSFPDASGRLQRTFRLRQYSALYPLRYDSKGDLSDQSQPLNTVYILDRPVDRIGQDPLKPITRIGPKPCPFSFNSAQFGQKCITDASLTGWNIDGTQIDGSPKCPIYPPVDKKFLKADGTLVIRPFKAYLPHYIENTTLRACAFTSSIAIDPEIVLSHDDTIFAGNAGPSDFWCAKYYAPAGSIIPSASQFNKAPGDCDLGAAAAAIKTDKTYACLKAFDTTGNASLTPSAGCCQICSGPDCTIQGGGITAAGRNAAFSPPHDTTASLRNPQRAQITLPRALPNIPASASNPNAAIGCFDPFEP